MVHMLVSPTPSEAEEFAHTHMRGIRSKDNLLIVVGCCSVEYVGRARSTLGWGERIIMVKPNGSVLVHQRAGGAPVNWQPPDTRVRYQIETDDGGTSLFVIYSYRLKPPEKMYVRFKTIETISAHRLRDDQVLRITGAESDIADRIMRDPDRGWTAHNRPEETDTIRRNRPLRDRPRPHTSDHRDQAKPAHTIRRAPTQSIRSRPPAPAHRKRAGQRDTLRTKHTSHDTNTTHRERTRMDGVQI